MTRRQRYQPKHEPGCDCSVCWTHQFCNDMHARNDAREKRCHEILNNPLGARREKFWTLERKERGTPFVPMERPTLPKGNQA